MARQIPTLNILPPSQGGDWTERVSNLSPGHAALSNKDARVPELIRVPWAKRYAAALTILGYSFVEGSKLRRKPPVRHPYWEWLHATACDIRGLKFIRMVETNLEDQPYYADYELAEIQITYEPLRYNVKTDEEMEAGLAPGTAIAEYKRYLYQEPKLGLELLHLKQGSLVFVEGEPSLGDNTKVPTQEVILRTPKMGITFWWYQVPEAWITTPTSPFKNIQACMGKVNNAEFLGYPKWTLLFESPVMEKYVASIRTGFSTEPEFYYDIAFPMIFYDPVKGVTASPYRGHNILPYRVDGKFYLAQRTKINSTEPSDPAKYLYDDIDFPRMFQKVT